MGVPTYAPPGFVWRLVNVDLWDDLKETAEYLQLSMGPDPVPLRPDKPPSRLPLPQDPHRLARAVSSTDPLRARLEAAVARLEALAAEIIVSLDELEGDLDTEPGCDDDQNVSGYTLDGRFLDDVEEDRADCEPECEDEGAQCDDEGHDSDTELVCEDEGAQCEGGGEHEQY